ncbi:MAG TPA: protease complex subunit PrcB family protein [Myxococcales bacterium]
MRPLLVVAGILAGCAAGPMDSGTTMNAQDYMPPIPAGARTETVRRIALQPNGGSSGLTFSGFHTQVRQVVQDEATWKAVWQQIFAGRVPQPPIEPVDFSKETVLLASMGDCSNSGFSISIDGAFADASGTTAAVSSTTPDPMCMGGMMTMQVITQPLDVVAIPKASAVTFAERGTMTMCAGGMPMGMDR